MFRARWQARRQAPDGPVCSVSCLPTLECPRLEKTVKWIGYILALHLDAKCVMVTEVKIAEIELHGTNFLKVNVVPIAHFNIILVSDREHWIRHFLWEALLVGALGGTVGSKLQDRSDFLLVEKTNQGQPLVVGVLLCRCEGCNAT